MAMHCSGANRNGDNVSMGLTFQKDIPIAEFMVDSAVEHYYYNNSPSNIFEQWRRNVVSMTLSIVKLTRHGKCIREVRQL